MTEESDSARRAAAQILRGWRQAGVDFLPAPRPLPAPALSAPAAPAPSQQVSVVATVTPVEAESSPSAGSEMPRPSRPNSAAQAAAPSPAQAPILAGMADKPIWPDPSPMPEAKRGKLLEAMRLEVAGCTRCKELAACRTQTVFGTGNIRPRLCFFGEAPGADEDQQGVPFIGRAGQLLDKIIEAMTLKREEVYILNTIKCRPPQNRTPLPFEVENCRPYFTSQFEILRPEFIVCLGTCAAQTLLQSKETIGKMRGRFFDYRGAKVLATYHPAYLLRNPPAKRDVWEDMKIVMREMGLPTPEK